MTSDFNFSFETKRSNILSTYLLKMKKITHNMKLDSKYINQRTSCYMSYFNNTNIREGPCKKTYIHILQFLLILFTSQ